MDHKAGNQLPHGWMMGFSTVQVEYISDIYKKFLQNLEKSPKLKILIKWHLLSISENTITKINKDFSKLASDITKVRDDVHKMMMSKGATC